MITRRWGVRAPRLGRPTISRVARRRYQEHRRRARRRGACVCGVVSAAVMDEGSCCECGNSTSGITMYSRLPTTTPAPLVALAVSAHTNRWCLHINRFASAYRLLPSHSLCFLFTSTTSFLHHTVWQVEDRLESERHNIHIAPTPFLVCLEKARNSGTNKRNSSGHAKALARALLARLSGGRAAGSARASRLGAGRVAA